MADSTYTKLFEQIYKRAEEKFFEEVYRESNELGLIKISEEDLKNLKNYLNRISSDKIQEAKEKFSVSYESIQRVLNDKGLDTFRGNVSDTVDSFLNTIQIMNNAIEQSQLIDNKQRYNYFLDNCGLGEKGLYSFLEKYSSNINLIRRSDALFCDILKKYDKTKHLSSDINNVELNENAITEILKQVNEEACAIYTIGAFSYNLFSMFYGCQLSDSISLKMSNYISTVFGGVGHKNAFSVVDIQELIPEKFFPNASRIKNTLREVLLDDIRNVLFIS